MLNSSLEKMRGKVLRRGASTGALMTSSSPTTTTVNSKLVKGDERTMLIGNVNVLVTYLLGKVSGEDMLWDTTVSEMGTSPSNSSDAMADAKSIIASMEKGGCDVLLQSLQYYSKETISLVIKLGFQSCDAPLIPAPVCAQLVSLKDINVGIEGIKASLAGVPELSLLGNFCFLLNRVGTPKSRLSYTFGPLLFLPRFDSATFSKRTADKEIFEKMDVLKITPIVVKLMEILITKSGEIFSSMIPSPPSRTLPRPSSLKILQAKVEYTFTAENPGELSVEENELVEIIEKGADGWWTVRKLTDREQQGLVPADYCIQVEEDLTSQNQTALEETILDEEVIEEAEVKLPELPERQHEQEKEEDEEEQAILEQEEESSVRRPETEPVTTTTTTSNPTLQKEILELKQQLFETLKDLEAEQEAKESFQVEIRDMRRRNVRLEEELAAMQRIQGSNDLALKKEVAELRAKFAASEAALAHAKEAEAVAKRQATDALLKVINQERAQGDTTRLQNEIAALQRANNELQNEIEQLKNKELDAKIAESRKIIQRGRANSVTNLPENVVMVATSVQETSTAEVKQHTTTSTLSITETHSEAFGQILTTEEGAIKTSRLGTIGGIQVLPTGALETLKRVTLSSPAPAPAAAASSGIGEKRPSRPPAPAPTRPSFSQKSTADTTQSVAPVVVPSTPATVPPSTPLSSSASTPAPAVTPVAKDPNQEKYDKMRRIGLSEEAIQHAIARDKAATAGNKPPTPQTESSITTTTSNKPEPGPRATIVVGNVRRTTMAATPFKLSSTPVVLKPMPSKTSTTVVASSEAIADLQRTIAKRREKIQTE